MKKKILIIIIPIILLGILYILYQKQISEYFYKQQIIYWSEDVKINFSDYQKKPDFDSDLKIVDYHGLYLSAENIENANVYAVFDKSRSWVKDSTDFDIEAVKDFQKIRFDLYEVYARKFNSEIDKIRHKTGMAYSDLEKIGNKIYEELELYEDEIYSGEYSTKERVKIWKPKIEQLLKESKNYR